MVDTPNSLGTFVSDLMKKYQHNNVSLAQAAGVSEGVIRNLLKHGNDARAKDPDPRTLRQVADALGVDALKLFRLAGYLPPKANANSIRAEYLADVFDGLPREKQDAVLGVLEAMTDKQSSKNSIRSMREEPSNPIAGIEISLPKFARLIANQLIVQLRLTEPVEASSIDPETQILQYKWKDLPQLTQERIKALIQHKLSLEYDPTMVDLAWRK